MSNPLRGKAVLKPRLSDMSEKDLRAAIGAWFEGTGLSNEERDERAKMQASDAVTAHLKRQAEKRKNDPQ